MKVIGATIPRTGTMSYTVALERLGYRVYSLVEALANFERGDLDLLGAHQRGERQIDWQDFLEGYDATADLPMGFYYQEMMEAFPEAKVILTVRDPQAWYSSAIKLWRQRDVMVDPFRFVPRFDAFVRVAQAAIRKLVLDAPGMDAATAMLKRYFEDVKSTVPEDRLLVFSVTEGWEPLCHFLGQPVPDEPFPHENAGTARAESFVVAHLMNDLRSMARTADGPELRREAAGLLELITAMQAGGGEPWRGPI